MTQVTAVSGLDLFSDEALLDPYPLYERLRTQAAVVWLERHNVYVLSRYADVQLGLSDWQSFTSTKGVALNDQMNDAMVGSTLTASPPEHTAMKRILAQPLSPAALRELNTRITHEADTLVERLVSRRSFDAVTDLAQHLPLSIVSDLVGLPDEGRDSMLRWATAGFNAMGPINDRTLKAFNTAAELFAFSQGQLARNTLKPGGWAARLFNAADRGELSIEQCSKMLNDYVGPSLDTTISATASAIWLFARHPDQWQILRDNPALIPDAINEVVRLESPLQGFTRLLTHDIQIDGTDLPAGARVLLLYGSANRDERKWSAPAQFDIRRKTADHLGFGHGVHQCVGANLARMEIRALLVALVARVKSIQLGKARRSINNMIRGWESMEVAVS
jgi:cytochrome P450